jgi:hypothetical protein
MIGKHWEVVIVLAVLINRSVGTTYMSKNVLGLLLIAELNKVKP